jgi:hypothetical protein
MPFEQAMRDFVSLVPSVLEDRNVLIEQDTPPIGDKERLKIKRPDNIQDEGRAFDDLTCPHTNTAYELAENACLLRGIENTVKPLKVAHFFKA